MGRVSPSRLFYLIADSSANEFTLLSEIPHNIQYRLHLRFMIFTSYFDVLRTLSPLPNRNLVSPIRDYAR